MTTKSLEIRVGNVITQSASLTFSSVISNSAKCLNSKPTSAEVKCSLYPTSSNINTIGVVSLDSSSLNLLNVISSVVLKINQDVSIISATSAGLISKNIHLQGEVFWSFDGNTQQIYELQSSKIGKNSAIEVIIPPNSCFYLSINETINNYKIPFTSTATIFAQDTGGNQITGTSLNSLASSVSSHSVVLTQSFNVPISGEIIINVVDDTTSSLLPCA